MEYRASTIHETFCNNQHDQMRDPQRCCEAVGSAILAAAWLLVHHAVILHLYSSRWSEMAF